MRRDIKVVPIILGLMDITVTESGAKPGSRTGRPNHDPEFRRRLAAAVCEPGVSVAKLTLENGINATRDVGSLMPPVGAIEIRIGGVVIKVEASSMPIPYG